ncbi:MAG: hypothetical protein CVU09_00355 [Bacteroidetes bacterium HGW-Bacteroidetes-4]|jgi:hypothetical protein|nr:MAG: hypothetical protein CVU09_00355 [Bacteroidetes bacterium HGW-Bacteroidetes-4]
MEKQSCKNCKNMLQLMKHPQNIKIGNGNITEHMGFVCTVNIDGSNIGKGYFFENSNGLCELFQQK